MPVLDSVNFISSATLDRGIAIPANSNYNVFKVFESEKDYDLLTKSIGELLRKGMRYEITYRSIQDEHWMIHSDSEGPEKLD